MSRIKTQPDIDTTNIKMTMIHANINRIYLQNHKLKELLEYTEEISKLKQVVEVSNQNWEKMASIAQNIQKMHQKSMQVRNIVKDKLVNYEKNINQTLVRQIQSTKNKIVGSQNKIKCIKLKHSQKIKKEIVSIKNKIYQRIQRSKKQCTQLIKKIENEYHNIIQQQTQQISTIFQKQFIKRSNICQINLGLLSNFISYQYFKKNNQNIQDVQLNDMVGVNFGHIHYGIQQLDVKQKKIKNQVQWLKLRNRKEKNMKKGQQYQPQEIGTIDQLELGLRDSQYNLKGLDIICEQLSKKQGKCLSQSQINTLIQIKQKLKNLNSKLSQYSSFYKSYY